MGLLGTISLRCFAMMAWQKGTFVRPVCESWDPEANRGPLGGPASLPPSLPFSPSPSHTPQMAKEYHKRACQCTWGARH